jgi:maleamate amidohydrolase
MTITNRSDESGFFNERGFGLTIGFGSRPAILSIDFMNGFTDESMPLGANLDVEIEAAVSVLEVAREKGIPVFHTIVRYDDEDVQDSGVWKRKQGGLATLLAGTRVVEIDERIGRLTNEQVIVKKYASAFFGTDLASRLVSLQIDTLLLLGCTTSGCVRASAVDAVQLGFRPSVVREAVGDRSPAAHRQALFDLEQKYADVVTVSEAIEYLKAIDASN